MPRLITIDGTQGEGGGQVVRTSLSLSAITGRPIHIDGVRGGRAKPGLMRQHLTAARAVAAICDGALGGDTLKSETLTLTPGPIRADEYRFDIGTAGSTALVIQTVLPILLHADGPSTVTVTGGTHNLNAPSADYLMTTFIPCLSAMGADTDLELVQHGFYPAGGGEVRLRIKPWTDRRPMIADTRGETGPLSAHAIIANLRPSIATREIKALQRHLGIADERATVADVVAAGPGNSVMVNVPNAVLTEQFTTHGQHGIKAETLCKQLANDVQDYLVSEACVGEHLADQLLLPMALAAGGRFDTPDLSLHTRTNMDVIRAFGIADFDISQAARKRFVVEVTPRPRP